MLFSCEKSLKQSEEEKTFNFSYLETCGSEFKQADFMYNTLKQRMLNVLSFKKKKKIDRVCQNLEAALTLAYCCGHLSLPMSGLVLLLEQFIKCPGTLIVSLHFLAASICMTNVLQGPVL